MYCMYPSICIQLLSYDSSLTVYHAIAGNNVLSYADEGKLMQVIRNLLTNAVCNIFLVLLLLLKLLCMYICVCIYYSSSSLRGMDQ